MNKIIHGPQIAKRLDCSLLEMTLPSIIIEIDVLLDDEIVFLWTRSIYIYIDVKDLLLEINKDLPFHLCNYL